MASTSSSSLALCFCLFLSLLSLSTSSLDFDLPSLRGDDIHDLLQRFGFPKGLLPDNVKSYTVSEDDGAFSVDLTSPCYVEFGDQLVYFGKKIAGKFSYGIAKNLNGIQAKEGFLWLPVTAMTSDQTASTVVFSVGFLTKSLPASLFEDVPSCSSKLYLQDA
ncbi:PREDICTED: uncharacterized protein LOC104742967 [Camelina sativa]|uniref:Uncharacterized protein LOC104742967 n=1 Tax=Camelina sativa TaxID=90675 RepID=A0ABM0VX64_CAMSA|nr:PREDICTED: uncharacterized protein LOC104742967 [Camelina sativa]